MDENEQTPKTERIQNTPKRKRHSLQKPTSSGEPTDPDVTYLDSNQDPDSEQQTPELQSDEFSCQSDSATVDPTVKDEMVPYVSSVTSQPSRGSSHFPEFLDYEILEEIAHG